MLPYPLKCLSVAAFVEGLALNVTATIETNKGTSVSALANRDPSSIEAVTSDRIIVESEGVRLGYIDIHVVAREERQDI